VETKTKTELGNRMEVKVIKVENRINNKKDMGIGIALILAVNILILGSVREILKHIKDKIK
jgi:plasmid maintenance system antidote protein VapI